MRKNSGITLIALIITIIVLLILAGIAILSISGENGILANARKASEQTKIKSLEEELKLKFATLKINSMVSSDYSAIEDIEILENGSDGKGDYVLIEYKDNNFKVYISENGENVTDIENFEYKELNIYNCDEMIAFGQRVNSGENFGEYIVRLKNDLDFEGAAWDTIGYSFLRANEEYSDAYFSGIFDGENHIIENITIEDSRYEAGIFGNNQGTIKNLKVENLNINKASGYILYIGGIAGVNSGRIINCSATVQTIIESSATNYHATVGAIVGDNSGTIEGSIANGSLLVEGKYVDLGGIVGENTGNVKKCINNATVNINEGGEMMWCGGFAGGIAGLNSGNVYQCKNTGTITGYVGSYAGIVGQNKTSATIEECINKGNLLTTMRSGNNQVYYPTIAGICASNSSKVINSYNIGNIVLETAFAGRLYGGVAGGESENCYSAGIVSGGGGYTTRQAFGNSSSLINCYYDSNVSVATDSNATPITTSVFKSDEMITNLGGAYKKNPNGGYPLLNWE